MKYRLLAMDIDGTLIGKTTEVPADIAQAVSQADAAGMKVVLTTGRTYKQALPIWKQLKLSTPYMPMVIVGGAMVSEVEQGRTLYQRAIQKELACEYADALDEAGYSAMAFVDPWRHNLEYVLAESRDVADMDRMWFSKSPSRVRRVRRLADADGQAEMLRLTAVTADLKTGQALAAAMRARFSDRLLINTLFVSAYDVTIVEATNILANKWTALLYIVQGGRIRPSEVVAIGDDSNDIPMLEHAGLSVAMPNSSPEVAGAADCIASQGLAEFIRRLVSDNAS